MATYTLPHFGQIDTTNLEDSYDVEIEFDGDKIEIDLNFDDKAISIKRLDKVKKFIEKIGELDIKNKKYIEKDYKDEDADTVRTYVQHHLEEMERENLKGLVDFENEKMDPEIQLMRKLRLVRIGFYPDDEDEFAVFDYSIGTALTNYLVVININENGKLEDMTMES